MDLVNLMYRYINRFINVDEILDELQKIDLSGYSLDEQTEIKKLIKKIQKIKDTTPNEVDDVERDRIANITHILESLNDVENSNLSDDAKAIQKKKDQLWKDKDATYDGGALYQKVFDLLTQNKLVGKYARKMNNLELLEFITEYISVPMPPVLTQDEFDDLTFIGIEKVVETCF